MMAKNTSEMGWISSTHAAIINLLRGDASEGSCHTDSKRAYFFFKSEVVLKTPFGLCRREKAKENVASDDIISEHSA
jgi:hypothetical protein